MAPERLRFDFSHPKPIEADELEKIEVMANEIVAQNGPVETRLMAYDDALETGAMALFGEKYGDEVRVVSMGTGIDGPKQNKAWSVELCGGTHVARTGDIGVIHIVSESASAAGVRRVEALTAEGRGAIWRSRINACASFPVCSGHGRKMSSDAWRRSLEERKQLERQLADAKRQLAMGGGGGAADQESAIEEINGGVKFLGRSVEGLNPKDLRGLVDAGKKQVGSGIVAIVGVTEDGKAGLAVGVTDDMTGSHSAVDLVRTGARQRLAARAAAGVRTWRRRAVPDGAKAGEALAAVRNALGG